MEDWDHGMGSDGWSSMADSGVLGGSIEFLSSVEAKRIASMGRDLSVHMTNRSLRNE